MIIGTRGSELALWQARHIQARLGGEQAGVALQIIKTSGDKLLEIPLQQQTDKGFFTKELEVALADHRVDLAVHSLKDLPTQMPPGLVLSAIPVRADVHDLLLVRKEAVDLSRKLPIRAGSRVGTASMRRMALLKHVAPDVLPTFLRGNVPTRLNKAISGEMQAVILARAGLARLGLDTADLAVFDLNPDLWLPAAAQGALGIQARGDDPAVLAKLALLRDANATQAVELERGLLRQLEGGCHAAFGAHATPIAGSDGWQLLAGLEDAAGNWRSVAVRGPVETLVLAAYAQLIAEPFPEASRTAQGLFEAQSWYAPARAWS